jgi:hypothetical protein
VAAYDSLLDLISFDAAAVHSQPSQITKKTSRKQDNGDYFISIPYYRFS